jgi:protein transport protein SEC23
MGGIDPSTTVALYFEVANPTGQTIAPNKRRYIQLITQYQHASGGYRMRVTTIMGGWHSDPKDITPLTRSPPPPDCDHPVAAATILSFNATFVILLLLLSHHHCHHRNASSSLILPRRIARGFDQEAAAVLMARLAVHRTETEETSDILR